MAKIRREAADVREGRTEPLDDEALILLLARQVLGGPRDDGRSSYQVAVTIAGTLSTGLRFMHADGTTYGRGLSAAVVDVRAKAFQALVGMGFREKEAKGSNR